MYIYIYISLLIVKLLCSWLYVYTHTHTHTHTHTLQLCIVDQTQRRWHTLSGNVTLTQTTICFLRIHWSPPTQYCPVFKQSLSADTVSQLFITVNFIYTLVYCICSVFRPTRDIHKLYSVSWGIFRAERERSVRYITSLQKNTCIWIWTVVEIMAR